jgi:polyribonucleotide nucleotidyltransferase
VNVTKFGAFVNILPGRDGLLHISKLGEGKRIDRVEDVLNLGDAVEVVVEDIDPQGKVSLSPVGYEAPPKSERSGDREDRPRRERSDRGDRPERGERRPREDREPREETGTAAATVSFEDAFESELKEEFGDLGPASSAPPSDRDSNRRPRGGGGRGRR